MERVHNNREQAGLGGTYKASGEYDDKVHYVANREFLHGYHINLHEFFTGEKREFQYDNPFIQISEEIETQPEFFEDYDRTAMVNESDDFERQKVGRPKDGTVEGDWFHYPIEDRDDKLRWVGLEADNLYSDPADSNLGPAFDHRLDEEVLWNFPINNLGMDVIQNQWATDPILAMQKNYLPYWAKKLQTPAYFTEEKLENMKFQWDLKQGLENLKFKHSLYGKVDRSSSKAMS